MQETIEVKKIQSPYSIILGTGLFGVPEPQKIMFKDTELYDLFEKYLNETRVVDSLVGNFQVGDSLARYAEFDVNKKTVEIKEISIVYHLLGKFLLEANLEQSEGYQDMKSQMLENNNTKGIQTIVFGMAATAEIPEDVMRMMNHYAPGYREIKKMANVYINYPGLFGRISQEVIQQALPLYLNSNHWLETPQDANKIMKNELEQINPFSFHAVPINDAKKEPEDEDENNEKYSCIDIK